MDSCQKGLGEWLGTEGCLGTSLVCHDSRDAIAIWLPSGKESACQCSGCKRCRFYPWVRKIPWRKKQQPTSVFLLGKSREQRSLVGSSPWGHKESDTTEHTRIHCHLVHRGQRCSQATYTILNNPRPSPNNYLVLKLKQFQGWEALHERKQFLKLAQGRNSSRSHKLQGKFSRFAGHRELVEG